MNSAAAPAMPLGAIVNVSDRFHLGAVFRAASAWATEDASAKAASDDCLATVAIAAAPAADPWG